MEKQCDYCKKTNHESVEDIENCINIRVNIVNSNLIMHGYTGARIQPISFKSN